MSDEIRELIEDSRKATRALERLAGELRLPDGMAPCGVEDTTSYRLRGTVPDIPWLERELPGIAQDLGVGELDFTIVLVAEVYDLCLSFKVEDSNPLIFSCREADPVSGATLPEDLPHEYQRLQQWCADQENVTAGEALGCLRELEAKEKPQPRQTEPGRPEEKGGNTRAAVRCDLEITLKKEALNESLEEPGTDGTVVKSFLFQHNLVEALSYREAGKGTAKEDQLADLEGDFFRSHKRTIVPVLGASGCLQGDLLVLCGADRPDALVGLLSEPLSELQADTVTKIQEFRQFQGVWPSPPEWLVPETFTLSPKVGGDLTEPKLVRLLESYQALLAILFLADHVEREGQSYRVQFSGIGRSKFSVDRRRFLEAKDKDGKAKPLGNAYELYKGAYERLKADKLEIAQQFLSLMVDSQELLLEKARDVWNATQKTYERGLKADVKDYFDARDKVHGRVRVAVAETASDVLDLTRDVSSDLYRIAGLIAVGVGGALLKPEISRWTVLATSLVIVGYMVLVLSFHLATLLRTYNLRMRQHQAYICSFEDLLLDDEIKSFVEDKNLKTARRVFYWRCAWAAVVYAGILTLALIAALHSQRISEALKVSVFD